MRRTIINVLKKIFPVYKLKRLDLIRHYLYDYSKYKISASFLVKVKSKKNFEANITRLYHGIEKGLSHNNLRLGFGQKSVILLIELLNSYKDKFGIKNSRYRTSLNVIKEYIELHNKKNFEIDKIEKLFHKLEIRGTIEENGGSELIQFSDILDFTDGNFYDLSRTRRSVRSFSNKDVSIEYLNKTLDIAKNTPSVCNRQDWKVLVIKNKKIIKEVLYMQKGIRGYEENINTLILILSDTRYLDVVEERNQGYIDGGLFSMSVLYSLHYMKLGSCALNACMTKEDEIKMRKKLNIERYYNLIMFIAVGHYKDTFSVAKSHRDSVNEFTEYIL